jgi:phage terminase small subunit
MAELTDKQKRFVEEYIIDLNATAAYIRAGYEEKGARANAARLIANDNIQVAIQSAMQERSKRTQITADRVLQEYARIGFADMKDYLSYKTALTQIGHDDEGNPIIDYAQVIQMKDSDEVDGAPIAEVSITKDGTFKFKFHDKKGSLDSIARHLGMFNDKLEHSGAITHTHKHNLKKLSAKELADLEHIIGKTADTG